MKKALPLLLAATMLLCLCACDKDNAQNAAPAVCNHSYKAATCTTPKTCSLCGATEGDATGHTLTAVCTACGHTNTEYAELTSVNWCSTLEEGDSLTISTYYFLDGAVDIGYNRYVKLEKLVKETGKDIAALREEYTQYDMLKVINDVEYVYDGWGMDNWSARKYTEENGVVTIQFMSLNWNEADEEVWTVAKTAVLTRTGLAEFTITGGNYCEAGAKLTPKE